jgi:hypothetical protein
MKSKSSVSQLTEAEIAASDYADSHGNTFTNADLTRLFGPRADSQYASTVRKANPRAYRRLRASFYEERGIPDLTPSQIIHESDED